jgi:antiphage defense system Thoeris ThsB-like protein
MPRPPRAFVAFDYDHDSALRDFIFGQSKHPDTNFEMHDWSVKEPFALSVWKERVRTKIRGSDLVIVICGENTHTASGVDVELRIAQEERKPYFLLAGYPNKGCTRPNSARASDKMYKWSWENLKLLVRGNR